MRGVANFLLFQAFWFACVLGAAEGRVLLGPLLLLPLVAANLWLAGSVRDLRLWLLLGLLGWALDSALLAAGVFAFPERDALAPPGVAPLFIASLWVAFATLLRSSLAWLAGRPWLAAALGAVGGPLSYRAGIATGAVELGAAPFAWAAIAAEWAVVTPLFLWLAHRAPRRAAETVARGAPTTGLALVLPALPLLALPAPRPDVVPARESSWSALVAAGLDPSWILPDTESPRDLVHVAGTWLSKRFEPSGDTPVGRVASLGDAVALLAPLRDDPEARDERLAELEAERPELWRELGGVLSELLCDDRLRGDAWKPSRDADDDGILFHEALPLRALGGEPWSGRPGRLQQAAVLVFADLDTIKAVENDYTTYLARVGSTFDFVDVIDGSFVRGEDEERGPFAALRLAFESDLPWPFSRYACDMVVLNRLGEDGLLVCDIHSKSSDFHWFAGRDVFRPVETSDGRWVATLVVRQFGFDLAGVPDGDGNRRESVRITLGNVKRDAEARFDRDTAVEPERETGRLPDFEVVDTE